MNKILVTKEFGWSAIGNGTDGFALAEAFYFDKPLLIEVGIQGTIPEGIQVRILPTNGGEVLTVDSATPIATKRFNFPTNAVTFNVERKVGATEEGPFTGSYSIVISSYGE